MDCPFELPVKISSELDDDGLYRVRAGNKKLLFDGATKKEADYIVQVINSHEKLKSKTYGWCNDCGSLVVGDIEHLCDKCGGGKIVIDPEFELVKLKQALEAEKQ